MTIYPIVFSDRLQAPTYISTVTRSLPIDLWQMFQAEHYRETLHVTPPSGMSLVEVPESTTIENEYFSYSMTFTGNEDKLIATRTFRLLADRVPPAAYAAFRQDMQQLLEAEEVQLAYRSAK
jgi:hypothetical protein